jgi:hypothetical protein
MIKIQSYNYPIVYQVDRSYSLPGITGQVRWNGNSKCFEVCDNTLSGSWIRIDNTVELSSDGQISDIINWAKKKMEEEKKLDKLMSEYPSLKAAKEHLDMVLRLVDNDIKLS